MNMLVPAASFEATLSAHYAAVRLRLRAPEFSAPLMEMHEPTEPALLLEYQAPAEPHEAADPIPDQRGKDVMPIGAEAEIVAARRALMIFARLREEKPSSNSVRHLQMAVAEAFRVDLWAILGRSRRPGPVRIRHIAMMLAHCC